MFDFDIIFGLDLLDPYNAILDYFSMSLTLSTPSILKLEWKSALISCSKCVIYFLCARPMVGKVHLSYLAYVRDNSIGSLVHHLFFILGVLLESS